MGVSDQPIRVLSIEDVVAWIKAHCSDISGLDINSAEERIQAQGIGGEKLSAMSNKNLMVTFKLNQTAAEQLRQRIKQANKTAGEEDSSSEEQTSSSEEEEEEKEDEATSSSAEEETSSSEETEKKEDEATSSEEETSEKKKGQKGRRKGSTATTKPHRRGVGVSPTSLLKILLFKSNLFT
jgi:chromatin remodeling complex protein RSC6